MIVVDSITKRYGSTVAVDALSFTVHPGVITGLLGPNGAGKSTTMRVIMGLDTATSGHATVNGESLPYHRAPLREVGALLEARAIHPDRSAWDHLAAMAATNGIPARRVREVLDLVGLTPMAKRRAGAFSLGVRQRLGIAGALLGDGVSVDTTGDPHVLRVRGLPAATIGERALAAGIPLHSLIPREASLEEAFMRLPHDAVDVLSPC